MTCANKECDTLLQAWLACMAHDLGTPKSDCSVTRRFATGFAVCTALGPSFVDLKR